MLRIFIFILVTILTLSFPINTIAKPDITARNAVLIDQETGKVLYEKAAHDRHLIASITKMMTAIIAIESGKMEKKVTITNEAVYTEGSSIYLEKGEKIPLEDLVYGLMLRSGNDAATAIAEYVGGSVEGFAYLMNEKAEWLGMENTHFDNPHGLDSKTHYSTAYDMAILTKYAMNNSVFAEITSAKSYKSEQRTYAWGNKHKLLTHYYPYTIGGKTGYTKAAGRTLISIAEKNDIILIAVTLQDPNDWQDHIRLFDWGFDQYATTTFNQISNQSTKKIGLWRQVANTFNQLIGVK
ncbi:D-alanyl-D-alanine carboxypeptidase family protein [Paraliobacillus salinarum]|uniref:D-alanyl-D-alanine carboxypeptidase family protein n=1 Tax=Paraliobacillus salinarum TaxID=1158996 RepID=UPI0015F5990E|nr:D-alanyl-D-alanine carboxypeptidase family protein [Paraliobacillus salinarum]